MNKSEKYFLEWSCKGSMKQRKSLNHIKLVCDELVSGGVMILGSVVGRCCVKKYGSPAYGTLKNNQVLMEYIRLRALDQGIWNLKDCDVIGEGLKEENLVLRNFIKKYVGVEKFLLD